MKKIILVAVLILVSVSFTMAQLPLMANGKHDFSASAIGGATKKGSSEALCGYCHTPHVPATGVKVPLWARAKNTSGPYGVYTGLETPVTPTAIAVGDNNVSSLCLGCHDGSALFTSTAYVKKPYAPAFPSGTWPDSVQNQTVRDAYNLWNGTKYGTGLSHTHPVNFAYADVVAALPDDYQTTPLNGVDLFGGTVQCASCHDPHEATDAAPGYSNHRMLPVSTDRGLLCISCHKK